MTETIMALIGDYGAIGLGLVLAVNCLGVPFPMSLVMLAVGSLVESGDMTLAPVLAFGIAGSILGDNAGYAVGRWGGPEAVARIADRLHAHDAPGKAAAFMHRWGAAGVFFTRWLLSPLGPYVNLAAGAALYPWRRFLVWGALGEAVWVVKYVGLGYLFSSSVQQIAGILGDVTWFLVGGVATAALAVALARTLRHPHGQSGGAA